MIVYTALTAFLVIFIGSTVLALLNNNSKTSFEKPVESYLLANASLKPSAVISLLLSTSFGLNYLFFQIWIGYTVGVWGLVTQAAWFVGMVLLGRYSNIVKSCRSLHELLGSRFDFPTRIIASIFSIVGILFMMGWETGIGSSSLTSIFESSQELGFVQSDNYANLLIIFIVSGSLFYTVLGGLKGNANADILLNMFKTITVTVLATVLIIEFWEKYPSMRIKSFFPSFDTMREKLGLWGLITSVVFSLVWQFVDNSTWQTIIAGSEKINSVEKSSSIVNQTKQAKINLFFSGIAAFIAPGIIGTLLGIGLISDRALDQKDIFKEILILAPNLGGVTIFCVFAMIIACVMSLIDGLFLTSAYTLIIDIIYPQKKLSEIDSSKKKSENILILIRISLVFIAIISLWGIRALYEFLGLKLFDCFYVMMITQLSLIGPVFIALSTKRLQRFPMWISIILSGLFGFALIWIGNNIPGLLWLIEGAGTFTIVFSCIVSYLFSKSI